MTNTGTFIRYLVGTIFDEDLRLVSLSLNSFSLAFSLVRRKRIWRLPYYRIW
jgi:hypothetical protein